jgi:hypothetical protein
MTRTNGRFHFLTMEEFRRLTGLEKLAYLEAATVEIENGKGAVAKQSIFKDGPNPPMAGPAARQG